MRPDGRQNDGRDQGSGGPGNGRRSGWPDAGGTVRAVVRAGSERAAAGVMAVCRGVLPKVGRAEHAEPGAEALRAAWAEMERRPPADGEASGGRLLVLAGYRAPWVQVRNLERSLVRLTHRREVVAVAYPTAGTVAGVLARVRAALDEAWPGWPGWTDGHAVDVVGVSMGGLVGRSLAMGLDGESLAATERRLAVRRMITLCSPHRGAVAAEWVRPDALAGQMRAGSAWLRAINAAETGGGGRGYPLIAYTQTADWLVGASRSVPEGAPDGGPGPGDAHVHLRGRLVMSHFLVSSERAVLVDVARRLRGEGAVMDHQSTRPRSGAGS